MSILSAAELKYNSTDLPVTGFHNNRRFQYSSVPFIECTFFKEINLLRKEACTRSIFWWFSLPSFVLQRKNVGVVCSFTSVDFFKTWKCIVRCSVIEKFMNKKFCAITLHPLCNNIVHASSKTCIERLMLLEIKKMRKSY